MGTAHAGHDQCAHCYFQYVKPQLAAERQEVKRRRALKRGLAQTPTHETRQMISELDLKQQAMTVPPKANRAIKNAILDVELNRMVAGKSDDEAFEVVAAELIKVNLPERTAPIRPEADPFHIPAPKKEVPQETEEMTKVQPEERKNRVHTRQRRAPLTDEERKDITDAFAAGLPTPEIAKTWGVGVYTIYQLADQAGLPRRGRGRKADEPEPVQEDQSMPDTKAVSVPAVEPAPANGVVSGLPHWAVTYSINRTETFTVAAKSFNDAAAAVAKRFRCFKCGAPQHEPNVVCEGDDSFEILSVAKAKP